MPEESMKKLTRRNVIKSVGAAGISAGLFTGTASAATSSPHTEAIWNLMRDYNIPGLSCTINTDWYGSRSTADRIHLGKIYADPRSETEVDSSHRFRIGSISKTLTSAAVLTLVENGSISLGDPVFGDTFSENGPPIFNSKYPLATHSYQPLFENITVENLLSMTSGFEFGSDYPVYDGTKGMTQDEVITEILNEHTVEYTPGSRYEYQNFCYLVLGQLIEEVTNRSYADYVQQTVLEPVGATGMQIGGDSKTDRINNEVFYHSDRPVYGDDARLEFRDAHGGWVGSPTEVLRIVDDIAYLYKDGGHYETGSEILATSTAEDALEIRKDPYALGWVSYDSAMGHNGRSRGAWSSVRCRDDRYSFCVMANHDNTAPRNKILNHIDNYIDDEVKDDSNRT
ncbi:serine hydrolase domain-containing protein [Natrinema longum]|uniref:Beta-lactamase family protein n=1 Tax=Natrinema longum TaxID=370324 RepID=A0A8A2U967_9EURY|nr:serine hydrolase domain-containing protein [Natrinema longum]MBZ6493477.1 beta-lactamase family protein [Natrinema longum]QSW85176.1 beta-lactamase family protein [Natrinema longum]